jgi:predicted Fe-Mo cluster-binding NifX family protein
MHIKMEASPMRIAVAASDRSEDADVSSRAARAPFYFIYDAEGRAAEVIANPFNEGERVMGLRIADFLASKGVGMVIARRFGSAFVDALQRKGVRSVIMNGAVRAAAASTYAELREGVEAR